jgi:hypothetical protein
MINVNDTSLALVFLSALLAFFVYSGLAIGYLYTRLYTGLVILSI